MTYSLKSLCFTAVILMQNFEISDPCARAEYEIEGECCPMCAPGNRVFRHCTIDTSTTCVPCAESTYTSEPNGLIQCHRCTVCDDGQGLRVKTPCTRTSDTVCEPQDGYYCRDHNRGSCTQTEEHIKCHPGQYIKQKGTALEDTECAECTEGTFSNGSLQICQLHSKCEDLGLTEKTPGTSSSDAECGSKFPDALTRGIIVSVVIIVTITAALMMFLKHKCTAVQQTDENNPASTGEELELEELEVPASPTTVTPMLPLTREPLITFVRTMWKKQGSVSPHDCGPTGDRTW